MKKILIAVLALTLFALPALAETKIATVDMQKALNNCKAGEQAKNQLDELVHKYESDFKAKQDALQAMQKDVEQQAAMLSDSAKKEKAQEFQQKIAELSVMQKQIKSELQKKDKELTEPILEELLVLLKEISEKDGYNVVMRNETLIFADDTVKDLTDDLIAAHDAK
jgi:outer membrane protein